MIKFFKKEILFCFVFFGVVSVTRVEQLVPLLPVEMASFRVLL